MSGCGGYVYGNGLVTSPNNLPSSSDVTDCIWFVEARHSDGVILLKKNSDLIDGKDKSTSEFPTNHPVMTVRSFSVNLNLGMMVLQKYFSICAIYRKAGI
jgi:hypothetical protein